MIDACAFAKGTSNHRLYDLNFTCPAADLAGSMFTQQVERVFARTLTEPAHYFGRRICCLAHNNTSMNFYLHFPEPAVKPRFGGTGRRLNI